MAVDHADDGHAQVTSDTEGDAEADSRENGDNVAPGQTEACAVNNGNLLLLHQLRPALCRQLDGLAIFLLLLKSSVRRKVKGNLHFCKLLQYRLNILILCRVEQPLVFFR